MSSHFRGCEVRWSILHIAQAKVEQELKLQEELDQDEPASKQLGEHHFTSHLEQDGLHGRKSSRHF